MSNKLLILLLLLLVVSTWRLNGQVTVNMDSGNYTLFNQVTSGTNALSGGTSKDGDGDVLQLGYYSTSSTSNNFSGTWIPLTGASSANIGGSITGSVTVSGSSETYNLTSIGDVSANGAGNGTFAFTGLTFTTGTGGTGNNLPAIGTPLSIRFYNGTTIASSTDYNTVSDDLWLWTNGSSIPPPTPINISLNDANLEWESISVDGQSSNTAFHTTLAIPEPSTCALLAIGISCMGGLSRRKKKGHGTQPSSLLVLAFLLSSSLGLFAAPQMTLIFDTGAKALFADPSHCIPLSAGSSADGDGCVVQAGYYTAATVSNKFAGTWVPLTGEGSANTAFNQTSIGDSVASGAGNGTMALSLTFVLGSGTTGNNLPAPGTPLAIRFYNGVSVASSSAFNAVSCQTWLWQSPQSAPSNPMLTLSLNDPNLEWLGGGGSAFFTSQTIVAFVPPKPGTYQAIVTMSPASHSGFLALRLLNSHGEFSAKISIGGRSCQFHGTLNSAGQWQGTVNVSGVGLLKVALSINGAQLRGTFATASNAVYQIDGGQTADNTALDPSPYRGTYTILMAPPANANVGTGFGTLKVDALGNTKLTGMLADGTPVSSGAKVLADGTLLISMSPYGAVGGVVGKIAFRDQPATSDADGVCQWNKPALASAIYYPDGLDMELTVIASTYSPAPLLTLTTGTARLNTEILTLSLSGGGLTSPLEKPVTLTRDSRSSPAQAGIGSNISLNAGTGTFVGVAGLPDGVVSVFGGAIFQKQHLGGGFFRGVTQSGRLELAPEE